MSARCKVSLKSRCVVDGTQYTSVLQYVACAVMTKRGMNPHPAFGARSPKYLVSLLAELMGNKIVDKDLVDAFTHAIRQLNLDLSSDDSFGGPLAETVRRAINNVNEGGVV